MLNTIFTEIINDNTSNNEKTCLISNIPLDDNSVCLDCDHEFNYYYLYNEMLKQKLDRIGTDKYLKHNEIKCPYCRCITKNYLPYFKYYNVKQYNLYTKNDISNNLLINSNECQYMKKNGIKCNNLACKTKHGYLCNKHVKYTEEDEINMNNFNDLDKEKYKKLKNEILRDILKKNNISKTGNKDELVYKILYNKNKLANLWIE
mgnify:CR=1 FL=1